MNDNATRKLVIIPYAELVGYKTGANVQNVKNRVEMYMKNCSVACISARAVSPDDTDVMLVSNVDISEPYKTLLDKNGVLVRKIPFDCFDFDSNYTWSLAFYKLCALRALVNKAEYDYYAYFDADVYFQHSIDNVWEECNDHIMLYDISHGLQVPDYCVFLNEVELYLGERRHITHYGGEFFAASSDNAKVFSQKCYDIYLSMMERNIVTTKGDEYIVSIAADLMKQNVKNASAYVYRFWSGISFRLVSTCYKYNAVSVLHVPAEKTQGIIRLFDRYICKSKIPARTAVYRALHFKHVSVIGLAKSTVGICLRKIIKKIIKK